MYDAIVVGARCAGSSTAMLLARKGYRVLLLDRDRFPSDMAMSTHLVHQRGMALLARWGLLGQIQATNCRPVRRCEIDLGAFTLAGVAPAVDGQAESFAPRRLLLDNILLRAATTSGAEMREGCLVEGLLNEEDQICGVRARTASGTVFSESARIIIGADGSASRVASEVQAAEYNGKPALMGTTWMYWSGIPHDHLELHFRPYEAAYAFPTSDWCTLIGISWSMERFHEARRDIERAYFDGLSRTAPLLADQIKSATRADGKIYLGSTRNFFRKAYGPGWALVGDASYKKDPCTAQGITDAFYDADLLVKALDAGLSDQRPLAEALADYERQRDQWAMPFYELTCGMATFAPPPPEMMQLYEALHGNGDDTTRFIGLITEAVSPTEFFAPENIQRIMQG